MIRLLGGTPLLDPRHFTLTDIADAHAPTPTRPSRTAPRRARS
ncbi:hypothetical protein ABT273_35940 [Streptomyces humidus]